MDQGEVGIRIGGSFWWINFLVQVSMNVLYNFYGIFFILSVYIFFIMYIFIGNVEVYVI